MPHHTVRSAGDLRDRDDCKVNAQHCAEVFRMTSSDFQQTGRHETDVGARGEAENSSEDDQARQRVMVVDGQPYGEYGDASHSGSGRYDQQ